MSHEKFHYKSIDDVREKVEQLGIRLPLAASTDVLKEKLRINDHVTWENRLGIAPMEGADSQADGSPSAMTEQRYVDQAIGGSGVIWFEAISIVPEARSSSHQLMLTRDNLDAYKKFTTAIKEAGMAANGYAPYLIMQANHSGRYSNPNDKAVPLIAYRHPAYEKLRPADDSCIVSDDYLSGLEERFGEAAGLAKEAGFDAVDIKACHGYLLMELLSAYNRPGLYGGSLENRTRLLRNAITAAKVHEDEYFMITARIGIYDGFAYPYGFGVTEGGGLEPDLTEPIALIKQLHNEYGLSMVNLTMGNPYVNSHVTRPYDIGKYQPDEHPFVGEMRMIRGIGTVKQAVPGMIISASAMSYLRQYSDLYAAGAIEEGLCDSVLFGRMSFANPHFPNQIINEGRVDEKKVCIACGKCGDLIRAGKPTGCVVRNPKVYLPYYREYLAELKQR